MTCSQQSVAVGGFTATITDLGDRREITVARAGLGPWVYQETTLASLSACVERFTGQSASRQHADQPC
ncbi:hypothetical protein GBZ48_12315 [Azospirillum melinis]|uniref:Uncharacterized protein n=1 Tax=Azospirillum melinis TaxID=328839 RepID=A0ABX2KC37_9PROT|nr:hypothetical protein [Azospirillum melinis]MBP2307618.1 hypothetical protein [Azospirillum melinis]NUB00072.1 hypothetical protein [Azospirillum melinis]